MINNNEKINISGTYVRNLAGAKIVDGKEVEGGYFVCESLPSWGTIGQLCYCTTDNKYYRYTGDSNDEGWKEQVIPEIVVAETTVSKITFTLTGTALSITTEAK